MSYSELNAKVVKCRRPHSCEWCAERINVGEMARYRTYVFDGDFGRGYMHPECVEASNKVDHNELMDGWTPGDYARGSTSAEPREQA